MTLNDPGLSEFTLESLPLLHELRQRCLSARTEVCIERARWITRSLMSSGRQTAVSAMQTRYAAALKVFLSEKEPVYYDDNLLAGTTTSKAFGAPVYPEFTGLTIWPELDTISTRRKNPQLISETEKSELNMEIFPYWVEENILEVTRKRTGNPQEMRLFEKIVYFIAGKSETISHTVPCYRVGIEQGVEWLIAEARRHASAEKKSGRPDRDDRIVFYEAVATALEGIIIYSDHLAERALELAETAQSPETKKNLLDMAAVCRQVPAKPAKTFREAVNSLWLLNIAVHAENINMAISPGRLDQILYPWYRRDIDAGNLNVKEVLELAGCLWFKLNDLTYLMLKVTELLKMRDPSVNARYYPVKNSDAYLARAAQVIRSTRCVPALYNDISAIDTLTHQGTNIEHARDYAVIGCVELGASGRSYDASSSIILNLVAALELALYNGKRPISGDVQIGPATGDASRFEAYADFEAAFRAQLSWLISQAVKMNESFGQTHQLKMPTSILSALFEGPMDKGRDLIFGGALYNSSGATHIGFADTVDSLNAIEQTVFIDQRFTLTQILTGIKSDYTGEYEAVGAWLRTKAPKYGTSHRVAVRNSTSPLKFLYDTYQGYTNYRGGKYRPAYWTMTNHAGQGKLTGALPSGRKAGTVFSSGITPVSQAAKSLAECINAVGRLEPKYVPGGEAFNMKMFPVESQADFERFVAYISAYFSIGGLHIQFNLMDYKTLIDARACPEKYPDLLVRVSGYSAYFNDLNDAMKNEIITRTAYSTQGGFAIPLPLNI